MKYVVQGGAGYLMKFRNNTPHFSSDPQEASEFSLEDAAKIIIKMEKLGLSATISLPLR